jgi:two-component system, OmpR family, phosphate regulon response regulator PhoB
MQTLMPQGRVLVVDGDPACRRIIADILAEDGFVTETSTALAANVDVVKQFAPDVVIIDLPGDTHGDLELLDQLKSDADTRAIPVIVSSTDARLVQDLAVDLQRYRCQTILKPFEIETLLDAVRAVAAVPVHANR